MSTYIVVTVGGSLVDSADALFFVGVQSGGLFVLIARCSSQAQAQAIVDALNGTP